MRERFKEQLEEFYKVAFEAYQNEALWDEGLHPEPMAGDKFYLIEESAGDEFDGLIFYSEREEDYYEWNDNSGEWQRLSDEDVPDVLCKAS